MSYYSKYFSKLEYYLHQHLSAHLGQYTIRHRTRPEWLYEATGRRLELDFYIEELNVAIEVQGMQHYEYNPHFHADYEAFRDQKERDALKEDACRNRGIVLYEVSSQSDADEVILSLFRLSMGEDNRAYRKSAGGLDEAGQTFMIVLGIAGDLNDDGNFYCPKTKKLYDDPQEIVDALIRNGVPWANSGYVRQAQNMARKRK